MFGSIKAEEFGIEFTKPFLETCEKISVSIKQLENGSLRIPMELDFEIISLIFVSFFTAIRATIVDSTISDRIINGFIHGLALSDDQRLFISERMKKYLAIIHANIDDNHFEQIGNAFSEILIKKNNSILSAFVSMNYLQAFGYASGEIKRNLKKIK